MRLTLSLVSMNKLLLLLVLTAEVAVSQDLSAGKFVDRTYENDSLGLSYTLPGGFVSKAEPAATGLSGSKYLFIADAANGLFSVNRILLTADDASQYSVSLRDYATKMTKSLATQPETVLAHDIIEVHFANKLFYRSDFNQHSQSGVLYKTAIFHERRGYFLTWFVVAHSEQELETVIRSLGTISFHDVASDLNAIPKKTIPSMPGKRLKVPETVSKSLILKKIEAEFPADARGSRVVLKAIVDPDGRVSDLSVISGNPSLTAEALRAAGGYRFKPYVWQEHRVEMETQITIEFGKPVRR